MIFWLLENINDSLQNDKSTHEEYIQIRKYTSKNINKFENFISNTDWTRVTQSIECKDAFKEFYDTIKSCYNQAFPLIRCKRKRYCNSPWMTDGLRTSINTKNKLYKKSLKHPTAFNKTEYSKYRNKLNSLIKKQQKKYYGCLIKDNKNNLSKTWDIIKSVIGRNKTAMKSNKFVHNNNEIFDNFDIANHFNDFFTNIGPNLAKKIPHCSKKFDSFLKDPSPNSIFLKPVTTSEIEKIIQKMKNGSPGLDDICAKPIISVNALISEPLRHICQLSIDQGCFPCELKIAKIVPLYKSGEKTSFNNYRPISLLPLFSKILERIMYNRLYAYLEKYELLYKYQFGFRKIIPFHLFNDIPVSHILYPNLGCNLQ